MRRCASLFPGVDYPLERICKPAPSRSGLSSHVGLKQLDLPKVASCSHPTKTKKKKATGMKLVVLEVDVQESCERRQLNTLWVSGWVSIDPGKLVHTRQSGLQAIYKVDP